MPGGGAVALRGGAREARAAALGRRAGHRGADRLGGQRLHAHGVLEQHPLGGIGGPMPPGLQDRQRLLAAGGQPGELVDAAVGDQRQLLVREGGELRCGADRYTIKLPLTA